MGQCSIQAPDQTCSIHMQEQLHRLGQGPCQGWGTRTTGHPQHPWVLGLWASLPPLEQGDRGLGCSHGWDPITGQEERWHKEYEVWPVYSTRFCTGLAQPCPLEGPGLIPRTEQP